MQQHILKCWPVSFQKIWDGIKTFEFRKNDRHFMRGDRLILREYQNLTETYTGREIHCNIPYILTGGFGLPEGYVVMSLFITEKHGRRPQSWIKERDTQAFPTEQLEQILPGSYRCVLPFTNEMQYKWKEGEEVQVVRYREQHGVCICRINNQPQEFEMLANTIKNHFSFQKVVE